MAYMNGQSLKKVQDNGIKLGGFPEEIFFNISEKERGMYECNICYLILNDGRQCRNRHRFCSSCIFAWGTSNQINNDRCPVCRVCDKYIKCHEINSRLSRKLVRCHVQKCFWKGLLCDFMHHKHGFEKYNNEDSNVELPVISGARRLYLSQYNDPPSPQPRIITRQNMYSFDIAGERTRREMRFSNMRAQINYGRLRLQSMMADFGDELEQRRQSLISYQRNQAHDRLERANEVHRLGVQLNNANSNLTGLLNDQAQLMSNGKSEITNGRQTPLLLRNAVSGVEVLQTNNGIVDSHTVVSLRTDNSDAHAHVENLKRNNLRNLDWSSVRPKKP